MFEQCMEVIARKKIKITCLNVEKKLTFKNVV